MSKVTLPIWSVHDIFVQANVVHGYRYLDLSGIVLNILSDRFKKVDLITPGGTSLSEPLDTKDPFKIQFGPNRLWLHYVGIDAVQKVEGTAPEMIQSIANKLEMTEFNRYGVRVRYFVGTENVREAAEQVTRKLLSSPIAELVANRRSDVRTSFEIPLLYRDMEVIFRFQWIAITQPAINPGDYRGDGLILDIDVGQRDDNATFRKKDFPELMSRAVKSHSEFLVEYGQTLLEGIEV